MRLGEEFHAGYQSRVFRADGPSGSVVVKLTDSRQADSAHGHRVHLLSALAEINAEVVGPIPVRSELITRVDDWFVACYPMVDGIPLDPTDSGQVTLMAESLARLHHSLVSIGDRDSTKTDTTKTDAAATAAIPTVAALREAAEPVPGVRQLIHGDFGATNVLMTPTGIRVIDFDNCGYGTVEFELGNTLYMAMFDGWVHGTPGRYPQFRRWFLDAYQTAASVGFEDVSLDTAIQLRVSALHRWLEDLSTAPIGIRSTSPEWHRKLRTFVDFARTGG